MKTSLIVVGIIVVMYAVAMVYIILNSGRNKKEFENYEDTPFDPEIINSVIDETLASNKKGNKLIVIFSKPGSGAYYLVGLKFKQLAFDFPERYSSDFIIDRMEEWPDYPIVGGDTPKLVRIFCDDINSFQIYMDRIQGQVNNDATGNTLFVVITYSKYSDLDYKSGMPRKYKEFVDVIQQNDLIAL